MLVDWEAGWRLAHWMVADWEVCGMAIKVVELMGLLKKGYVLKKNFHL